MLNDVMKDPRSLKRPPLMIYAGMHLMMREGMSHNTGEAVVGTVPGTASNGQQHIVSMEYSMMKAEDVGIRIRRLLQATTTSQATPTATQDSGGLSVAWIAAIVINAILIVLFIVVVVYCYCRNRKPRETDSASTNRHYRSNGDIMYVEKAASQMEARDKNKLVGRDGVYPDENQRGRHRGHHPDEHYHTSKERCTCNSPECYCSTGDDDGVRISTRASTRRVEDSYHEKVDVDKNTEAALSTPVPVVARFPTPEPSVASEPENSWTPENEERYIEEDNYLPGTITPVPEPPRNKHYLVYKITIADGTRENIGQILLSGDTTLTELRRVLQRDSDIARHIDGESYRFLDEDHKEISTFQESTTKLNEIYPYQAINLQYLKKVRVSRKAPAYVGPLGMCSEPECANPARIKCLDCGSTAYCSTRCMRNDQSAHKSKCYKPPWRH